MHCPMGDLLKLIWWAVIAFFRSRASLEAEILTLRHQLNVLRRESPKRLAFGNVDRLIFATLYRFTPHMLDALAIVKPETVVRWHRAAFARSGDGSRDLAAAGRRSRSKFAG